MADQPAEAAAATAAAAKPITNRPELDNSNPEPNQSDLLPSQPSFPTPPPNPSPNPSTPATVLIPPPSIQPYPAAPSFRPATPSLPQFAPLPVPAIPNLSQTPTYPTSGGLPPPGVSALPPAPLGAPGQVPGQSSLPPSVPPTSYVPAPGQLVRPPYAPLQNGYPAAPLHGISRFPSPYAPIVRPTYPPRPGIVPVIPPFPRPLVPVLRPSIVPPIVRPVAPTPPEKPQTTVYIGKISPTVENDFMLSLLQLCGPLKSWKRPQDPTNGTLKGFGLYEFESPEGVLRALRLLSKLCIDGQELMLNVNQATRGYLERYVAKKLESSKTVKEADAESTNKEEADALGDKTNETANSSMESPKPLTGATMKDDTSTVNRENADVMNFGLVSDEDRQADQEVLEKIKGMIEERLKNKPPPPPPSHTTAEGSTNSDMEVPARSKDGELDIDLTKDAAEDKNDNEMITENKPTGDQDRLETSSPDRDRKQDRRRDREREVKREKERELERYEREREQDRAKREKDREYRIREDERRYKAREKEWEAREKEKEHWRKREKEREKDRAHERKREVMAQEREIEDGYGKKRKYRSSDDERRRWQREKEEDMADRLKEEEEIAEAKRRAEEEFRYLSEHPVNGNDVAILPDESNTGHNDISVELIPDVGVGNHIGEEIMQNGIGDESIMAPLLNAEARNNTNASSRKLGFGLLGSGKRTAVPSVFNQDEDEDTHKEKKMRPLVPIDYSTEEQVAVQQSASEAPSNLVAAAEFAKRISAATPKEEKSDMEKERNKRSYDRHSQRDKDRNTNELSRNKDEIRKENHTRDRDRDYNLDKAKTPDNQKLLDAKQLIDMIPKTKDELFSYEINWDTYDRNALQERMKPWISKKITEFLGEEEPTLVDYIVSSTREHVKAAEMLDRLQGILDEEAEMFVLKMWRMLIFEIKRVETGLALRSRS